MRCVITLGTGPKLYKGPSQGCSFSLGHWTYNAEVISSLKRGENPLGKEMLDDPCPGN